MENAQNRHTDPKTNKNHRKNARQWPCIGSFSAASVRDAVGKAGRQHIRPVPALRVARTVACSPRRPIRPRHNSRGLPPPQTLRPLPR